MLDIDYFNNAVDEGKIKYTGRVTRVPQACEFCGSYMSNYLLSTFSINLSEVYLCDACAYIFQKSNKKQRKRIYSKAYCGNLMRNCL